MYLHIYMSYVYIYHAIRIVCKYLFTYIYNTWIEMYIYIIQISQTQSMGLLSASRFNMGLAPSY